MSKLDIMPLFEIPDTDPHTTSWISDISLILRAHGLELLVHEHIPLQDRCRALWNQSHFMGYEEMRARKVERQDHGANVVEESDIVLRDLVGEMESGVSLDARYFCFVARKIEAAGNAGDT